GPHWDRIIVIKKPISECYNSEHKAVSSIWDLDRFSGGIGGNDWFGWVGGSLVLENANLDITQTTWDGSTNGDEHVLMEGVSIRLKPGTHLKPYQDHPLGTNEDFMKINLRSIECETYRSTFN
ncbi:MAG: hypothetical protein RIF46_04585, partial [Cyclobacteriaceae bacterium]